MFYKFTNFLNIYKFQNKEPSVIFLFLITSAIATTNPLVTNKKSY